MFLYRFCGTPNLKNRALASTGARFSQNRRFQKMIKKRSILDAKTTKIRQKIVSKKHAFFHHRIFNAFFRFWLHFGGPWGPRPLQKFTKNRPRCSKKRFWDAFGTRLFLKVGFGRVLGAFWEEFWWILRVADYIVDSYFALCWDKLWLGRPREGQWRSTNQILR